jgi:glutathione S-transferase
MIKDSGGDIIHLYYAPHTRSSATLLLLQELGLPYDLHVLNMKAGEQRQPAYLAINPMGKVPAVKHRGAVITEQVAIYIYLADLVPEAGLAPGVDDPKRGPYLRWLVFYGSAFEPAVVDRSLQREPGRASMMPYGDYDTMFNTLVKQLEGGPYILGEIFSAADLLWGSALNWMTQWKLVPNLPVIEKYVARITARPLFAQVQVRDAEIAATQGG